MGSSKSFPPPFYRNAILIDFKESIHAAVEMVQLLEDVYFILLRPDFRSYSH